MKSIFAAEKAGFVLILAIAVLLCSLPGTVNAQGSQFKVLVFGKTEGFRHSSIPQGYAEIGKLGLQNNFQVDATEDAKLFTDENLKKYKVVIFLNTTGDLLNEAQQDAFTHFIRQGNGHVGVHASTDTEYEWEWYGGLVGGAFFLSHPKQQKATVIVEDFNHPSTTMLPQNWVNYDEWYNFKANPRSKVRVLATLDESTYDAGEGAMGDHPIAWCHIYDGGRVFYTGLGHREDTVTSPLFLRHLLGGIKWAAGVED